MAATSYASTSRPINITSSAAPLYRQYATTQQTAQRLVNITDDYERWYTETNASNRMLLSLRSGISSEIAWALDRLYKLCDNEQFVLRAISGLTDALFEWPEWFVSEGYKKEEEEKFILWSPSPENDRKRRNALESLFVLRNSSLHDLNAQELASHPRSRPLLMAALRNLNPSSDAHVEFLLNSIDILQTIAPKISAQSRFSIPEHEFLLALERIAAGSSNRSLIIASLTAINIIFSNPSNLVYLQADSLALSTAILYLPLFVDKALSEACLNYLYTHLSHPPMARAFLVHAQMPSALRVLVSILLAEQAQETVTVDISGEVRTVPASTFAEQDHDISKEELDHLLTMPEPQRCYEWMKTMFVGNPDGELTQVDFWNLYKDAFTPYSETYPMLAASDVIKNVNVVFPQAQAMVLPGPPPRFIVKGVNRRIETQESQKFKCLWDRSQCTASSFEAPGTLYDHLLQHMNDQENPERQCFWSSCSVAASSTSHLQAHVLTHLSALQPPAKHPLQDDTVTLPSDDSSYPYTDPTSRPPPPARYTSITYSRPSDDPPSSALTALLCIRLLFRASFVVTEVAPRVDADHFGFPGVVEDLDDGQEEEVRGLEDSGREGERRGRKAFIGVRRLMEVVQLRDETLMGWIVEMVDAAIAGHEMGFTDSD